MWQTGSNTAIDLNNLAALSGGAYLTEVFSINNIGQIIAIDSNGFSQLLTLNVAAIPLPAAIRLFASGLGLLSFNRRKDKSSLFIFAKKTSNNKGSLGSN